MASSALNPTAEDLERGYVQDGPDRISVFNLPGSIDGLKAQWETEIAGKQAALEPESSIQETESLRDTAKLLGKMTVGFGVGGLLIGVAATTSIEHGVPFNAGVTPMLVGGFGVLMTTVTVWSRDNL